MTDAHAAEDRICALALGRTIAFLFYSIIGAFVTLVITFVVPTDNKSLLNQRFVFLAMNGIVQPLLLVLVATGRLPGTDGQNTVPFSERQAAFGLAVVSLAPWLVGASDIYFRTFAWLTHGFLGLVALVYFLVKSILSRRPRVEVLSIVAIPVIQLLVAELAAS